MPYRILVLGASYGSLLGTKLLMAGHHVTLVCRAKTAELINAEGTEVRIRLRDEEAPRAIRSTSQPGRLDARTPDAVDVADYDMVGLAMQEPQYAAADIRTLLARISEARLPCLSIMNMPPLPYLRRISGIDAAGLASSFSNPEVWDGFEPDLMTLCSPDPQAFRPSDDKPNVLQVGLATNFKAAEFGDAVANATLAALASDIDAVRLDGMDVPVKLRVFASPFVPLAKWSMLLTGNYRCITRAGDPRPICDVIHADPDTSRSIYAFVDDLARRLGADPKDLVPFEKYAAAAMRLQRPSSVARAISGGATEIERVDKLVQLIGRSLGLGKAELDETVATVESRLAENRQAIPSAQV